MKEKFLITIESYHIADNGLKTNVSDRTQPFLTYFFSLTFHVLYTLRWNNTFLKKT